MLALSTWPKASSMQCCWRYVDVRYAFPVCKNSLTAVTTLECFELLTFVYQGLCFLGLKPCRTKSYHNQCTTFDHLMQVWWGCSMQAVPLDTEGWLAHQPVHCTHSGWRSHVQPPAPGQLLLLQLLHWPLFEGQLPQLPHTCQLPAAEEG